MSYNKTIRARQLAAKSRRSNMFTGLRQSRHKRAPPRVLCLHTTSRNVDVHTEQLTRTRHSTPLQRQRRQTPIQRSRLHCRRSGRYWWSARIVAVCARRSGSQELDGYEYMHGWLSYTCRRTPARSSFIKFTRFFGRRIASPRFSRTISAWLSADVRCRRPRNDSRLPCAAFKIPHFYSASA